MCVPFVIWLDYTVCGHALEQYMLVLIEDRILPSSRNLFMLVWSFYFVNWESDWAKMVHTRIISVQKSSKGNVLIHCSIITKLKSSSLPSSLSKKGDYHCKCCLSRYHHNCQLFLGWIKVPRLILFGVLVTFETVFFSFLIVLISSFQVLVQAKLADTIQVHSFMFVSKTQPTCYI